MKKIKYIEDLKASAPAIAITTFREPDETFVWDGDGPDPKKRGFRPYDVTVRVQIIHHGELQEACSYLGGSYYRPTEPLGDIHGYLPQMIEDALSQLLAKLPDHEQLRTARQFIRKVMRLEYEKQIRKNNPLVGM